MAIFVLAMFQAVIYGWVFGIRRGHDALHEGAHIRVPWFVQVVLKYVTPVYLFAIFVGVCYQKGPTYARTISENVIARSSVLFIVTVLALLMVLVYFAGKRWKAIGKLSFDKDSTDAGIMSMVAVAWVSALLFATLPGAWAAMIISVGCVLVLCGYCLIRVLTLPAVETEHLKAPLDIDTGDT
jgi:hypothetical protein